MKVLMELLVRESFKLELRYFLGFKLASGVEVTNGFERVLT